MNITPSMVLRLAVVCGVAFAVCEIGTLSPARAQQPPVVVAPPPAAAAPAEAPPAAAPASTALTTPSMTGPLVANPNPIAYETEFGKVYVSGMISGLGIVQANASPGDHDRIDISNGQVILQKTDGFFQFYAQAGIYSFPALGTAYFSAERTTGNTFSPLPVAYIKLQPTDEFSVQAGKLPTLIGAESSFTFQNMNIERGLLWNQENLVNRGVQANYTAGPLAYSVSLNDGFYSDSYNWLIGSVAWTIDKANTLTFVGGGNFDHTDKNRFLKTPFFQNNGDIFNAIYTYNAAPWTITPYFQYTSVPASPFNGALRGAETYGGAILASYGFTDNFSLAGRAEIIGSTGSAASGSANPLGYGPGSSAFSFTLTPTWQEGIYFLRGEGSVVQISSVAPGAGFGKTGSSKTQGRFLVEAGLIF